MTPFQEKIPVSVLSGFLGSGKTTLLNRILSASDGRLAVVENEYGEVGVDQELVYRTDEELFETINGCLCCSVRGDLIKALLRLGKRKQRFDRILIETTGLADPGPVVATFLQDEDVAELFCLDGIITVVDAKHFPRQHGRSPEVEQQIAFADVLVLSKADLVTKRELEALASSVRAINGFAEILPSSHADIEVDGLWSPRGARLELPLAVSETTKVVSPFWKAPFSKARHDGDVSSFVLLCPKKLDRHKFRLWLRALLMETGTNLYRMKGFLSFEGDCRSMLFQGVHSSYHIEPSSRENAAWENQLVVIGRFLDRERITDGFLACTA